MAQKLPDLITTVQPLEFYQALHYAWLNLFNAVPKKESIFCIMAQCFLETGRLKKMHCWNMGNIKSSLSDGRDYTFYVCNEYFKLDFAKKLVQENPNTAKITSIRDEKDGTKTAIVWFYPDHPYSRFRAYKTLNEGALDYLTLLYNRYKKAWNAILLGNPALFSKELRKQGYYTADEEPYTRALTLLFREFANLQINEDELPVLSDSQKKKLDDMLLLSLQDIDVFNVRNPNDDENQEK